MLYETDLSPAPDFSLATFQGDPFALANYRDRKHVILVFNRGFT